MSNCWQPGQLLFCGFEGRARPDDLARLLAAGRVGGVILFARNVESPSQLRELTEALHTAAPEDAPLLIAIDQEGGRVQRLREPWTCWPPMRRVGDADDPSMTEAVATALAGELLDLGVGLDFAPVADVDTNPQNPVIGDRSFGRESQRVARHTTHFVRAMQREGVAACAKHFPGHGDTEADSHLELPRVTHDLERLRSVELPPFAAAVEAGVSSVMTAHVLVPAVDPERPATISPEVMALLRDDLGYEGVVFSDDLEMKAVADHWSAHELVSGCLEAGVDSVLVSKSTALRDEVLTCLERVPEALLERPLARVAELKRRYGGNGHPRVAAGRGAPPYEDHLSLARGLA